MFYRNNSSTLFYETYLVYRHKYGLFHIAIVVKIPKKKVNNVKIQTQNSKNRQDKGGQSYKKIEYSQIGKIQNRLVEIFEAIKQYKNRKKVKSIFR
jgi:hypothetical protein